MTESASRDKLESELQKPRNKRLVKAAKETIRSTPPPGKKDLEEMADEVGQASSDLVKSVDQIVEVLTLVLGNISEIAKTQKATAVRSRRALLWIRVSTVVSLFVLLATAYLLLRIDEAASDLKQTESRVNQAIQTLQRTDEKVEAVKQTADETSRVEIVPDEDESGSAVVRITPPKIRDPEEDASIPTSAVEIPIDLNGASAKDLSSRSPKGPAK